MFHERLAQLRNKKGISQYEIANRLGIARTTYSGYENGSREPDIEMMNKLANFFDVSVHWLVTGSEKNLSEEDEMLIEEFSKLNEEDQVYILDLIKRLKKD